jgi:hypothetical protein
VRLPARRASLEKAAHASSTVATAVLLSLACVVAGAPAEALAGDSRLPRVGVIVLSTGDTPTSAADNLTEVIIAAISQMGRYEIVGKEEFQSILGVQSEKRSLTCLHDTTCLSKVGIVLGIDEVVIGNVSERANVWSLVLDRVDVRRSKLIRHLFYDTDEGEEALLASVFGLADDLFAQAAPEPEPKPPPEPPKAVAPPPTSARKSPTMRYAAYAAIGLGVTLGAVATVYGLRVRNSAAEVTGRCCIEGAGARQIYDMTREEALSTQDDVESFTAVANVLYGGSVAAIGVGVALWLLAPKDPGDAAAFVVPTSGGSMVGVGASF